MQRALETLAKLLAILGMLNVVLVVSAAKDVSSAKSSPTTITLPMDSLLPPATITPHQLVVSTDLESIKTVMANENTSFLKPQVDGTSTTPTTFKTLTKSAEHVNYSPSYTSIASAPFHTSPSSKTEVFFNLTSSLIPRSQPFSPTCHSSALRAMWKWRVDCDTSPLSHLRYHCWARAPSPERCCDGDKRRYSGSPGSCAEYWPKNKQEETWCSNQCDLESFSDDWCKFGDEFNNPTIVCGCMVEKCGDRIAFGHGRGFGPGKRDARVEDQNVLEIGEWDEHNLGPAEATMSENQHAPNLEHEYIVKDANTDEQPIHFPSVLLNSTTLHPRDRLPAPRGADPFRLTCATSAERALWKWRSQCDRTPGQHGLTRCWGRAPSIERCCDPPASPKAKRTAEIEARIAKLQRKRAALAQYPPIEEDLPAPPPPDFTTGTDIKLSPLEKWKIEQKILDEEIKILVDENNNWSARMPASAIKKGAPPSCKTYWPVSRQEEFMCCGHGRDDHMSFEVSARGRSGWDGEGGLGARLAIGFGGGQGMPGGEFAKGKPAREGVERGIGWCEWDDGSKGFLDYCSCIKPGCGIKKEKAPQRPMFETISEQEQRMRHEGPERPTVESWDGSKVLRTKYEELLRTGKTVAGED